MNKWLLAAVVAVALAPLALIPAFATGHNREVGTNVYSIAKDCADATWIARVYMGGYHGGYARSNCVGHNGYNWKVGIRANDGALLYAYMVGPIYTVRYWHQ